MCRSEYRLKIKILLVEFFCFVSELSKLKYFSSKLKMFLQKSIDPYVKRHMILFYQKEKENKEKRTQSATIKSLI